MGFALSAFKQSGQVFREFANMGTLRVACIRCIIAVAMALPVSCLAQTQATTNWSDHYYSPSESGWGVTFTDHDTNAFLVYYTYAPDGHNLWFTMPGGTFSANHCVFSGPMYQTTGSGYDQIAFNPNLVTVAPAGSGSIDFCPAGLAAGTALFSFTLSGITQTKQLVRLPFGNASANWAQDYTDLWWNPNESGWGMNITQKGNNMFVAWYGYDIGGRPLFATMPGGTFAGANTFTSRFYTTTGPWFGNAPFNASLVATQDVGSATLAFANRDTATFTFTIKGVTQTKSITRQLFGRDGGGATYYVATSGSDTTGNGTVASPWKTIGYGISRMAGGDTLVVQAGTYAGKANFMVNLPSGSAQRETRVMAATPMEVRIQSNTDLDYEENQLHVVGNYVRVDGFIFDMAGTLYPPYIAEIDGNFNRVTRSIFKRSGEIDTYGGLMEVNGNDNLIEDVAGSGACRYCFKQGGTTQVTQRNIWRRVVGRFDYSNSAEPKATFSTYGNDNAATNGVKDHLYQNVIAIDGQNPGNNGGEEKYGGFLTVKSATGVRLQGCMVLNEGVGYSGMHLRDYHTGNVNTATHSVVWDLPASQSVAVGIKGYSADRVTVGGLIPAAATDLDSGAPAVSLVKPATPPATLVNNTPGAVILKQYGASGTRWGEAGYDQLTTTDLWPWPYQDKIKTVFAETNDVPARSKPIVNNTRRGFAAAGNGLYGGPITLTSYIWEYLGARCPATACP